MSVYLGTVTAVIGTVRKHPTLTAVTAWMAAGEYLAVRHDGETPAKTFGDLLHQGESRRRSILGTVTLHGCYSAIWLAVLGINKYSRRGSRPTGGANS